MAFRSMSRSTNGVIALLWLIAGAIVVMRGITQFTAMNRAAPHAQLYGAARAHMFGRRGQADVAQTGIARHAKEDDDEEGDKPAEYWSPTAHAMMIPNVPWFAVVGATFAAKIIGEFAEKYEIAPAKPSNMRGKK